MKAEQLIHDKFYVPLSEAVHSLWAVLLPASYAKYHYRVVNHKRLDLKNPKDYNEKVQWLKIYSDTASWTALADKYKVREYVKQCGLENTLVKLFGVWKDADEIDFDTLPEKFVLKTNNGCGKNILVYDKHQMDVNQIRKQLNIWIRKRHELVSFQPHMWSIDRRIIAEELLQDDDTSRISKSLIDYKFFCFHGEPEVVDVLFDRKNICIGKGTNINNVHRRERVFDLNWNLRSEVLLSPEPDDISLEIPRPSLLNEMITICRVLSKPFPQVRVDLYQVNNKVYFGELTFTPGGMTDCTEEFLIEMGNKIDLSAVKRRTKLFII